MSSIVSGILEDIDDILKLRDELGAVKKPVYLFTWIWPQEKGQGSPAQTIVQMLPSPYVINFSHSSKVQEGGSWKQGDLLLKHISKKSYPLEADVDCTVGDEVTEKWYLIDGYRYEVISVVEDYVYWNVQVRKTLKKRLS